MNAQRYITANLGL